MYGGDEEIRPAEAEREGTTERGREGDERGEYQIRNLGKRSSATVYKNIVHCSTVV